MLRSARKAARGTTVRRGLVQRRLHGVLTHTAWHRADPVCGQGQGWQVSIAVHASRCDICRLKRQAPFKLDSVL